MDVIPKGTTLQDGREGGLVEVGNTVTVKKEVEISMVQDYDKINLAAGDLTAETWDVSIFDEMTVTVSRDSGTTDSITIEVSADGSTYSPVPVSGRDASTGGFKSLTGLTSGQYTIPLNAQKVRFTKSGNTDPFTITWAARNAGRSAY